MKSDISKHIFSAIDAYFEELFTTLKTLDKSKIEKVVEILINAYKNNRKVFILGNGGSAANASHMATDLAKGTLSRVYDESEKRFKVYSLTDNLALLSAYANDLDYSEVFLQQLRNLVDRGDVVIALSGSGNSENVVKAIRYAKKFKALTVGILGFKDGGKAGRMVDIAVIANSRSYGICEDTQLILDHIITSALAKIKRDHDGTK